jgi:hypothetical protein
LEPVAAPIRTTRATELRNRQIQSAKQARDRKLAHERTLDGFDPALSPGVSPQPRRRPRSLYGELPKTLPSVDTQLTRSGSARAKKALKDRKKSSTRRETGVSPESPHTPATPSRPVVRVRSNTQQHEGPSPTTAEVNASMRVPSPLVLQTSVAMSPSPTETQAQLEVAVRSPSPARGRPPPDLDARPASKHRLAFHSPQSHTSSRSPSPEATTTIIANMHPLSLDDVRGSRRSSSAGSSWVSRRIPLPPTLDPPTLERSQSFPSLPTPQEPAPAQTTSRSVGASPKLGSVATPSPAAITPPPPSRPVALGFTHGFRQTAVGLSHQPHRALPLLHNCFASLDLFVTSL